MSLTDVPSPRKLKWGLSKRFLLKQVRKYIVIARRDADKTTSETDIEFYYGMLEALYLVERLMTEKSYKRRSKS